MTETAVTEATIAARLCGRDHTPGPAPCATCEAVAMDVMQLVVPHIRAAERQRVVARLRAEDTAFADDAVEIIDTQRDESGNAGRAQASECDCRTRVDAALSNLLARGRIDGRDRDDIHAALGGDSDE